MTERYFVGEDARLRAAFAGEDGVTPIEAVGVRVAVRLPNGTTKMYQGADVLTDGAGAFYVDHRVEYAGRHRWRADCAGPTAAVAEGQFDGVRSAVLDLPEPDDPVPDETYSVVTEMVGRAEDAAALAETALNSSVAAAQDAETARLASLDALAAAETAASAAKGPLGATAVAGALDVNGRCSAYTCVLPATLSLNALVVFVPHAASGPPPVTLRPTVAGVTGAAVNIREKDGTQILEGMLRAGETYFLSYDGTALRLPEQVAETVTRPTAYQRDVFYPGEAQPRHRELVSLDGRRLWMTGTGAAAPVVRLAIEADGRVRAYGDLRVDGVAYSGASTRFLTEVDLVGGVPGPAPAGFVYPQVNRLRGNRVPFSNEIATGRTVLNVPNDYLQVGGPHIGKMIEVAQAGTGSWLDVQHMPPGTSVLIAASGTAVFHLYCGEGSRSTANALQPHVWAGHTSKVLTATAGSWIKVHRTALTFLAEVVFGSVANAPDGVVMPAHDTVIGHGPQSWRVRIGENGAEGWRRRLIALGRGRRYYSPPGVGRGASCMLWSEDKADLCHWIPETDQPGPLAIYMVQNIIADRIARERLMGLDATANGANAPPVTDIFVSLGLNDMGKWGTTAEFPFNNPAVFTASSVKFCAYVQAQLGHQVRFWFTPLTSQEISGTFAQGKWHGVRMATLRIPGAAAAWNAAHPEDMPVQAFIAPEFYGDPRTPFDRHYDWYYQQLQADRDAHAWAKEVHGDPTWLGAEIIATTNADNDAGLIWDVTIAYAPGTTFQQAQRWRDAGFAMLPPGTGDIDADDFAAPLTILSQTWVAGAPHIKARVTLAQPVTSGVPRPVVLWGAAEQTDEGNTFVSGKDPASTVEFYLRQHLSGG